MSSNLFSNKTLGQTDQIDEKQAMAALMVRIAKSDDDYAQAECERIDAILMISVSYTHLTLPTKA